MYRGRIAPSPTGLLHLGHARTFWIARQRALKAGGRLVLRIEDIDRARCKPEFREAIVEDLRWFGLTWDEGPDCGGPFAPYAQSERHKRHLRILERLKEEGHLYPCHCSRRDVLTALGAPHAVDDEPNYPGTCRPTTATAYSSSTIPDLHWRFRVPVGEKLTFDDGVHGPQSAVAGVDFGDFIVWRQDHIPAYQLAVVADDAAMEITEVVRGADLLLSTFRQLLLYRALGLKPPTFHHVPLVIDPLTGRRLAKRHAALSLRQLRTQGACPGELRTGLGLE